MDRHAVLSLLVAITAACASGDSASTDETGAGGSVSGVGGASGGATAGGAGTSGGVGGKGTSGKGGVGGVGGVGGASGSGGGSAGSGGTAGASGGAGGVGGKGGTAGASAGKGGSAAGSAGAPGCSGGKTACGATCADLQSDVAHCGSCDNACPAGTTCAMGHCGAGTSCVGAACVTPSSCGGGSAPVFVAQSLPTGPITTGADIDVSVTFSNCTAATWTASGVNAPDGFKLGSQAPQDSTTWGGSRVALPADVPPAHAVKVPFTIHAPTSPGAYAFSWEIVHEGVAWMPPASPVAMLDVVAPPNTVTLCAGVMADASGATSATAALQSCIDATPSGGTLAMPPGVYRMDGQVHIDHPMKLVTAGLAGSAKNCLDAGVSCATLQAAPTLDASGGMLALGVTDHVTLDHLVLDGNRGARLGSAAAKTCASGMNRNGFNAMNTGATDVSFLGSASIRALCGTGFEWRGDRATITGSVFRDNGDNATMNMWSDGLTLLQSDSAVVTGNRFENNSDVSFICGGGTNATFKDNQFVQSTQTTFAAFMMDNFNGGTSGDFTGTTASNFTIDCTALHCHFGVEIGPHPWYQSANTAGGTVTAMTITGARQGLNVEGGGTAAAPVRVFGNSVTGSPTSATFNCGTRSTSNQNFSPDSFVDRMGDASPATKVTWHSCP